MRLRLRALVVEKCSGRRVHVEDEMKSGSSDTG
jgi:hypothetical protein